jgi:hypothetical protein
MQRVHGRKVIELTQGGLALIFIGREVSRTHIRLGYEPLEGMEVSRTTEGGNVRIRQNDTGFTAKAMKAETRKRTTCLRIGRKPKVKDRRAEPSEITGKGIALRIKIQKYVGGNSKQTKH